MTHTYRSQYFHLIWSTKLRKPWINAEIQSRLYPYMAAITRNNDAQLISIGGMDEHVHLLIECKNIDKFTSLVRDIKANSSKWVNNTFDIQNKFSWQEGYASYSVSYSAIPNIKHYIQNQEEHHRNMSFDNEYKILLNKHDISYDARFVLG